MTFSGQYEHLKKEVIKQTKKKGTQKGAGTRKSVIPQAKTKKLPLLNLRQNINNRKSVPIP